jgi:hypothetical protein
MVYTAKTIHSGDQAGGVSTKNAQDLESVLVDVDASVDEIDSVLFERKIKLTDEGGYAVSLINKTGAASVRGSLVHASSTTDNAVALQANTYDTFGIIYEDGVADGSLDWVVIAGRAQVLMKDSVGTTRGGLLIAADTDGRADWTSFPGEGLPATDTHFKEIGHCLETKTGGTNVLVYGIIHFN